MNRLNLITLPSQTTLGHGGQRIQRRRELRINDVLVDEFTEHSASSGYNSGDSFDDMIDRRIKTYEDALNCKVTRQDTPSTTTASLTERFAELTIREHHGSLIRPEQDELERIRKTLLEIEVRAFAKPKVRR